MCVAFKGYYTLAMVGSTFLPPTADEFAVLFKNGGSLDDIALFSPTARSKRGAGILSFLSGVAKKATPFLVRYIQPEAIDFGKRVLRDVLEGKSVKRTLRHQGMQSVRNIGSRIARGGRKKKKQKKLKCTSRRKANSHRKPRSDIFASL